MTLKRELQHLEESRAISPDHFARLLGISFRSAASTARQNKIAKHFNIPLADIDTIIRGSY